MFDVLHESIEPMARTLKMPAPQEQRSVPPPQLRLSYDETNHLDVPCPEILVDWPKSDITPMLVLSGHILEMRKEIADLKSQIAKLKGENK